MIKKINMALLLLTSSIGVSAQQEHTVQHFGALKNFMHQNDLTAKVDLKQYEGVSNLYGLGALEGLKGEILILNGQPLISVEEKGAVKIDSSFDHQAALFVASEIREWQAIEIPKSVSTKKQLEEFISREASKAGMDVDQSFPFTVKGELKSADWHVINWPEGDSEHSHDKHKNSGPHGEVKNVEVEILGFYSAHHHAIFTHHSTNLHMHIFVPSEAICGHLDDLTLRKGMSLLIPK